MKPEWVPPPETAAAARRHAALGDAHRLSIVEELLLGDRSPAWFAARWSMGSNLVAHHVAALVEAGLVERTRSEGDRRRVYLRATEQGRGLLAPRLVRSDRIVFVCTHNSARSQFAEALWRASSAVPATSGGTRPAERVHHLAAQEARRHGIDLTGARPRPVPAAGLDAALLVTVCDSADRTTTQPHLHWSVRDPAAIGTPEAFEAAWDEIARRIESLAPALVPQSGPHDQPASDHPAPKEHP
jgi:protein-tyrosine-phosphatase/DNA-binding HxlR family transcriptional regulator